jgi:hypothetical protein
MGAAGLFDLIKKAVELCMPDMRHYYRVTRKAKVVASYPASGGRYYADVKPLRNDETEDESEPVVPKVEIPVLWAGPNRGVVCPPVEGTHCDLSYYDGDPNYPRISNFRWHGQGAPEAALNEFVVQLEPGVEIRIDQQKQIVTLTPENVIAVAGKDIQGTAGKNWTIKAGDNASIAAGNNASMTAGSTARLAAPRIFVEGNVTMSGENGGHGTNWESGDTNHIGNYDLTGQMSIGSDLIVGGRLKVGGVVTAPLFDGPARGLV